MLDFIDMLWYRYGAEMPIFLDAFAQAVIRAVS